MPTPNTTPGQSFEDASTSRPGAIGPRATAYSEKSIDAIRAALDGVDAEIDAGDAAGIKTLTATLRETLLWDEGLRAAERSYEDGTLGFTPDLSKLEFPKDPAFLAELRAGLESGALNGLVITAFPTAEQVRVIAENLGEEPETLYTLPITEFLSRHFQARGGKLLVPENPLESWQTVRAPRDGRPLYVHMKEHGGDLKATYDSLPAQQALREVLGQTTLTFTNISRVIDQKTPLLQNPAMQGKALTQGVGLTISALAAAEADCLTPVEWLAMLATNADPHDSRTYPTPYGDTVDNLEWLAGISPSNPAYAYSLGTVVLDWDVPQFSPGGARARSAIRCTPGL